MATIESAMDELYGGDAGEFVANRKRLVARIRKDGDKELATAVGSLRKPSVAADAVNQLARQQDPPDIPPLRELGQRMRQAAEQMDSTALKALAAERTSLIRQLLAQTEALGATGASARDQLTQTFTAALASPDAQDAVCSGHLVNPLSYSGFGDVEVAEAVAVPLRQLQEARLAQLADREAERAEKPTRAKAEQGTVESTEPAPAPAPAPEPAPAPKRKTAGPRTAEPKTSEPKTSEPKAGEPKAARAEARPAGAANEDDVRRVYQDCLALEQQAQAAVEAARTALATAKEHAAAAGRARQAAEDLLDSLS